MHDKALVAHPVQVCGSVPGCSRRRIVRGLLIVVTKPTVRVFWTSYTFWTPATGGEDLACFFFSRSISEFVRTRSGSLSMAIASLISSIVPYRAGVLAFRILSILKSKALRTAFRRSPKFSLGALSDSPVTFVDELLFCMSMIEDDLFWV